MLQDCLRGIRVLDLSQYIPGPFATLTLSDLGADVVKVEPPAGDPMRGFGPLGEGGVSPLYACLNGNKTVLKLDLKRPEGVAALTALVAHADVMLESYRPGTLDKLGFGRQRLAALNPGLIHCALSGFGQDGPYRLRAGHDMTYLALTGGLSVTGTKETPVMPFPPLADHAGAMQAVIAIMAALIGRGRSGRGCGLDVSLFESALSWQYMALAEPGMRRGEALINGGAAYYRVYRTADGRFAAFAPLEPKFWQAFCAAVARPDLAPRQAEPLPQTALIAELETLFAGRTLAEWKALLDPADCCFEAVLEPAEVAAHPHVAARGLIAEGGAVLFPCRIADTPPPARRPWREGTVSEVVEAWSPER
ncbi:MAG: CoA transferase [Alphaproteobacteria bacterium]|nr:CoA transferase [Alphaproteobacteria bacterium]